MSKGQDCGRPGNVFADLDVPDPDTALIKADLAFKLSEAITAKGWELSRAASHFDLSENQLSGLIRGRLREFSTEDLLRYLNQMDLDVDIHVGPNSAAFRPAKTTVSGNVTPMAASSRSGQQEVMTFD